MTSLFVYSNTPGIDILSNSINNGVNLYKIDNNVDIANYPITGINRIGIMFDHKKSYIPFGTQLLVLNDYSYVFFKKELFNYVQNFSSSVTLDLITCSLTSPIFRDEVQKLKDLLPNVKIQYSLNATGGLPRDDWIMESGGESIKNIYFNANIVNYKYSLGASDNTNHAAVILPNGRVMTFGDNSYGQLGIGYQDIIPHTTPTKVHGLSHKKAIAVSCGGYHTAVLLKNGTVRTFGDNGRGQLGNGDNTYSDSYVPVKVKGLHHKKVIAVSCGDLHTAVLLSDGTVWTFGQNSNGQLGYDPSSYFNINVPIQVPGLPTKAIAIACGADFTIVLLKDGTVWTFGSNSTGQLGDGTFGGHYTPAPVIGLPKKAIAIACGSISRFRFSQSFTAVLLKDGTVWTFGDNTSGQLGDIGSFQSFSTSPVQVIGLPKKAISIACGAQHTIVLLKDHTVWGFGDTYAGELGDVTAPFDSQITPIKVQGFPSCKKVIAISCGDDNTTVLLNDCTVMTFGYNYNGQLGRVTSDPNINPIPGYIVIKKKKKTLNLKVAKISDSPVSCMHGCGCEYRDLINNINNLVYLNLQNYFRDD